MKETFYFSHDYNCRNDQKIMQLLRKHGAKGYGIFWWIIEDLYNNANALNLDYEGIAYNIREDENIIKSVIEDFGLFDVIDDEITSKSVQNRLDKRDKKSTKARQSANIRWSKNNANAKRTQSKSNAIKESKVKESKIKEKKVIKKKKLIKKENKFIFDFTSLDGINYKDKKEFVELWDDFIKMRKIIKAPLTERASQLLLKQGTIYNYKIFFLMIEQSISKSWRGIFPIKENNEYDKDKQEMINKGNIEKEARTKRLEEYKKTGILPTNK